MVGVGFRASTLEGLVTGDAGDLTDEGLVVFERQVEEDGLEGVHLAVKLPGDGPGGEVEGEGVRGVGVGGAPVHVAGELVQEDDGGEGPPGRLGPTVPEVVGARPLAEVAEPLRDGGVKGSRVGMGEPVQGRLGEPKVQD